MTVKFEGRNSIDYDGDALTYKWAPKRTVTPDMVPGLEEDIGNVIGQKDSYFVFSEVDLTEVLAIGGNFATNSAFVKGGLVEIRIGGMDGERIGSFIIEAELTGMELKQIAANLSRPITGKHDVYFLFKNDEKKPEP